MTTLEDLLEIEREAVNPTDADLERAARAVTTAVGFGIASASLGAAAASGVTATPSKFAALWGAKAVLGWSVTAAVSVGVAAAVIPLPWQASGNANEGSHPPTSLGAPAPAAPADEPEAPPIEPSEEGAPAPDEAPAAKESDAVVQPSPGLPRADELPRTTTKRRGQSSLKEDARLLSQVTSALNSGKHEQALSLMNAASLRKSPLASEFAAARAVALCSLGRHTEGKAQVRTLLRRAPDSPALLRVRRACDQ